MQQQLSEILQAVRDRSPLIHNITNYVVMNTTANALLAMGASPVMSHAPEEAGEMAALCQALVVNIGTLSAPWIASMLQAAARAAALNKPWVLDPVGAGATGFRDATLTELLALRPTVIRGNASEIMALARHNHTRTKGVDSTASSTEAIAAAEWLAGAYGAVVCISGARDIVIAPGRQACLDNGAAMMTRVTGLGCTASAMVAACCAVSADAFLATAAALALLGVCGQLAAASSAGPGSLQLNLLDKLYNITAAEFNETLRFS